VQIQVFQGEREMAAYNKRLGMFELTGLPPAPRGVPQIEVTFDIDANGILNVSAKDKATGKEQKIRIEASSGLSKEEIERMKQEAAANASSDEQRRQEADTMNSADSLIFSTEKQLKEYGDKIPAEKRNGIETALENLKKAHASKDLASITEATAELNKQWEAASADMYQASQQGAQGDPNGSSQGPAGQASGQGATEDVTDVDYEEVK